jgi:RHS repeat-associated protein
MTATTDPLGRTVTQQWCTCGSLDALVDANGNRTGWERDLQGRVTKEVRANGSGWLYVYETTTSRLKRVTDAKGQHKDYAYFRDDNLQGVSYPNPQFPTPNVNFTYDPVFNRVATMLDGTGTTTYGYHPITVTPLLGAGRLSNVDGPLANDPITYGYDELGRVKSRAINGVALTYGYDALGRITTENNVLGVFSYQYDAVTSRLSTVTYPNGQTTSYAYYPNSGDHRLLEIHHRKSGGVTLSKFNYTYDAVGNIKTWTQQQDTSAAKAYDFEYDRSDQLRTGVFRTTDPSPTTLKRYAYAYDSAGNRTVEQIDNAPGLSAYDNMNRLSSQSPGGTMRFAGTLNEAATVTIQGAPAAVVADNKFQGGAQVSSGTSQVVVKATDSAGNQRTNTYQVSVSGSSKTFTFDANGNMTGDGTRTFEWDAENRLLAINQGTLRSEFTYDGESRRVRIIEKSGSTVTSDRRFLWCAGGICEERSSSGGTVMKRYFGNGVQQSGQSFFYSHDHLGSIRELSDGAAAIKARYDYDPYGKRSVVSEDLAADLGFTGQHFHLPSQLTLAPYRAYVADLGRWMSEDPIGLGDGPNRYAYVGNNPDNYVDPTGRSGVYVGGPPRHRGFANRDDVVRNCGGRDVFGCVKNFINFRCKCVRDGSCWRPKVTIVLRFDDFIYWSSDPRSEQEEQKHVDSRLSLVAQMKREADELESMRFGSKLACLLRCRIAHWHWDYAPTFDSRLVDRSHPDPYSRKED